eukprot:4468293-Pleurochrysis_carterae.AAC.2
MESIFRDGARLKFPAFVRAGMAARALSRGGSGGAKPGARACPLCRTTQRVPDAGVASGY